MLSGVNMIYQKVSNIIDAAWKEFYKTLGSKGFTEQEVKEFAKQLNYSDVFSAVEKCAMESVR